MIDTDKLRDYLYRDMCKYSNLDIRWPIVLWKENINRITILHKINWTKIELGNLDTYLSEKYGFSRVMRDKHSSTYDAKDMEDVKTILILNGWKF